MYPGLATVARMTRMKQIQWTHKRIEWSLRVQAWQRSGRTQTEYCRRREWPVATFAWWKRRLGTAARDGVPPGISPPPAMG